MLKNGKKALEAVNGLSTETTSEKESFEGFVLPEICDGKAERIDGDEFVRYVGFENENKIGGVKRPL